MGHEGVKKYKCDTCGKAFQSKLDMTRHVDSVHLKKPVWQNVRKNYPGGKKPIIEITREFCDFKFTHYRILQKHIRSNHRSLIKLLTHLQANHENDSYQCKFCQQTFTLTFKYDKPGEKLTTVKCYDNQRCYSCEEQNGTKGTQSQKYILSY